jgi:PmbA protein
MEVQNNKGKLGSMSAGPDLVKENFEDLVAVAKKEGAKLEMLVSGGENLNLGFSQRKLEKFESTQTQMAGLRVILGSSQGYAYTENLEAEALLRTYREALANAKTVASSETKEISLVKPENVQGMEDLFHPEEIPMTEKMAIAKLLEEEALNADVRVQNVPYSRFSEGISFRRVLNSEGVDQKFQQSYYTGYSYALAKEGESSKMDGESFFARTFAEINPAKVAKESVRKALSRLGATKLKTGNYPVVIDRNQFGTILSMFVGYLSAKEVHEQKSLFEGKRGQALASSVFNLIDDPFERTCTGTRPFDSEGAASQKTVLFESGVLKNFLTNLEYAQKMNLPHTAHAARGPTTAMDIGSTNLIVGKGAKSLEELLKSPSKVLHLTNFSGALHSGYKESTGDFSMPAEGFLYEDGKCLGPVDQFVVSGNILILLKEIEAVSNSYGRPGSSVLCPDVLIKSLSVAGA